MSLTDRSPETVPDGMYLMVRDCTRGSCEDVAVPWRKFFRTPQRGEQFYFDEDRAGWVDQVAWVWGEGEYYPLVIVKSRTPGPVPWLPAPRKPQEYP